MAKSSDEPTGEEVERFQEAFDRRKRRMFGQQLLFGRLSNLTGVVLDEIGSDSGGGALRVWCAGAVLPLVLCGYAMRIYWRGQVQIPLLPIFAFTTGKPVEGVTANWEAAALVAWALLLNVQYFWYSQDRLARFYEPAKLLTALLAVGSTVAFIYNFVAL